MNQSDGQIDEKDLQTDRLMNTQTDRQTYTHNTKNVKTYYIQSSLMGRYIMIIKMFTTLLYLLGNKYFD